MIPRLKAKLAFDRKVLSDKDEGAYLENARLAPIHAALIECVDTLQFYADALGPATRNDLYEPTIDGGTNTPVGTRAALALAQLKRDLEGE